MRCLSSWWTHQYVHCITWFKWSWDLLISVWELKRKGQGCFIEVLFEVESVTVKVETAESLKREGGGKMERTGKGSAVWMAASLALILIFGWPCQRVLPLKQLSNVDWRFQIPAFLCWGGLLPRASIQSPPGQSFQGRHYHFLPATLKSVRSDEIQKYE